MVIGSGITGSSVAHHLLMYDGSAKAELADVETAGHEAKGERVGAPRVLMLEAREACWGATGRVCIFTSLVLDIYPLIFHGILLDMIWKSRKRWGSR